MNVPILMYHGIHDDAEKGEGRFDPVYSVTRRQFLEQLQWLADQGYQTTTCAGIGGEGKRVIITFDDGDRTNYTVSLAALQRYNMVAEYFITTDWIGRKEYMTEEQLRALDGAGMSVQSHGKSHRFLCDLPVRELVKELEESRERLQQILGKPVTALALPGGRGGKREAEYAASLGYRFLCTSRLGLNPVQDFDPFSLCRIAITRQLTLTQFADLVAGNGWELKKRRLRQHMLDGAKKLLGNRLYEKLRAGVRG